MAKILILPAILESYRSLKDKTLKVTFETSELTPEQAGMINQNLNMPGFLAFNPDAFEKQQIEAFEEMKAEYNDREKSPSKRLRNVLYRLYEQESEGFSTFQAYYDHTMEVLIEHFKSKLDE